MSTPHQSFVAFFSYVQRNDEHDKGRLTELRKLLEAELWAQTGKELQVFQDKEDIEWGDVWKEKITNALNVSTFLIVIVTPSYLESKSCRFEFEYFLKRESLLRLKDSILPIHYIDIPELNRSTDSIAVEISKRQWVDWRELRFVSLESAKLNKKIGMLAKRIRDSLSDKTTTQLESIKATSFPNSVTTVKHWESSWQLDFSTQAPIPSVKIDSKLIDNNKKVSKITILLSPTGDIERDRRRIKTLYGTLISFHGRDRFAFRISKDGNSDVVDFPNDTTRISTELLLRLKILTGGENWHVEEV